MKRLFFIMPLLFLLLASPPLAQGQLVLKENLHLVADQADTPVAVKAIQTARLEKQALNKAIYHDWSDERYNRELAQIPPGGFLEINLRDFNDHTSSDSLHILITHSQSDRILYSASYPAGRERHRKPGYMELTNNKSLYPVSEPLPDPDSYIVTVIWRNQWYHFRSKSDPPHKHKKPYHRPRPSRPGTVAQA